MICSAGDRAAPNAFALPRMRPGPPLRDGDAPVIDALRRAKPGWYVLAALVLYAAGVTFALQRANAELRDLRLERLAAVAEASETAAAQRAADAAASAGLWLPLPGASLPTDDERLPGAERAYRRGVSQGFDFYDGEVGVPVPFGAAVIAAADGVVERADRAYEEMSPGEWDALLEAVAATGATDEQLDRLRGRQVWIRADDGRSIRYAHLSAIRDGLEVGQRVRRGQVIGRVGNSGTGAGVAGTRDHARLHFEVWQDGQWFGEGLDAAAVRAAASSLFTGP